MIKPEWIIFDVGGVLFDYKRAFDAINKHLATNSSHIMNVIDKYIGSGELGTATFNQVWLDILKPLNKVNKLDKVIDMWWSHEFWLEDAFSLVKELKKSGYRLAILTNNWNDMGPRLINVPGIENFDYIFESSDIKLRKPDPAVFQYVEDKIQTTGNDILLIDDTEKNIVAAKSFGWQSFLYKLGDDKGATSNYNLRMELLTDKGNIMFRDSIVDDLPGINEVAHQTWLATYPNKKADITVEDVESVYKEDDPAKTKDKLERRKARYSNPNIHIWVAEDRGKIIGFCHAIKEEKANRIMAIYVLPKYHGTGTGKRLIEQAFTWLGKSKDILVNVVEYNDHAIGFYEHMGFVKTDKAWIFDDIARLPTGKVIPEIQMILKQSDSQ